jgi:hypothetical protein
LGGRVRMTKQVAVTRAAVHGRDTLIATTERARGREAAARVGERRSGGGLYVSARAYACSGFSLRVKGLRVGGCTCPQKSVPAA